MKLSTVFTATISIFCIVPCNCKAGNSLFSDEPTSPLLRKQRRTAEWSNPLKGAENKADAIATIYGSLIIAVSRNPPLKDELFEVATFGHAAALAGDDVDKIDDIALDIFDELDALNE